MYSTRHVVALLRDTNPGRGITEETIRTALRRGDVDAPTIIGGRYVWSDADVTALAEVLSLNAPNHPTAGTGR